MLSYVLAAARPVAVDTEGATLESGFRHRRLQQAQGRGAEARDRFADALKAIVGERLRPVYVLLEPTRSTPSAEAQREERSRSSSEFEAEFDAEEVDEPEARGGRRMADRRARRHRLGAMMKQVQQMQAEMARPRRSSRTRSSRRAPAAAWSR